MAISSTIYKADLQITDMDRNYYSDHHLVIARHPSESDERMMVRLLAFALHGSASLQFCKGISTDDEPDIWQKSLSDEIEIWIDLGQPDAKRIRKACGRSRQVIIYTYLRSHRVWWEQAQNKLTRFDNLSVIHLDSDAVAGLGVMAARAMRLQCTIQDGSLWLTGGDQALEITPDVWKESQLL
ncbi:YaeQ family protein [Mariprofundus sp. EBB-1]|uniref:YaeQ family protein n=1 Tax=Mariprofundus sp. EBB-1 TaxID=2650971 RepID=UPI000EF26F0D|nr:YaeQ family protein [Mariprofundus sp. EBB-1]RLL50025.1 YaeQ family protein [Mariprofundus sp. EBB-1]